MDGRGQGHKVWCDQACGEEGIHWAVQQISEEKGKGLIALRNLPKGYKIMAERAVTLDKIEEFKEQIAQLAPKHATLEAKWQLNAMRKSPTSLDGILCLRMSRANHSCAENAEHTLATFKCNTVDVHILNALRDIRQGEEICISYTVWTDPSQSMTAEEHRLILSRKWGIYCLPSCRCYDTNLHAVVNQARYLESKYRQYLKSKNAHGALQVAKELISLHEQNDSSFVTIMRNLDDAFRVAILCKELQPQAEEFIRQQHVLEVMVGGEECDDAQSTKLFLDCPECHPNWGNFDSNSL